MYFKNGIVIILILILECVNGAGVPTSVARNSERRIPQKEGEHILEFVKKLENLTNLHVSPCENFYQFTCGKYPRNFYRNEDPTNNHGVFLKYLKSKQPEHQLSESSAKALTFYNSCRENQTIDDIRNSELFRDSGGCPAINDDYKQTEWTKVFAVFHNYGIEFFLKLKISVQDNKRKFQLEPNFRFKHTIETIRERITKVLQKFNISQDKVEQITKEVTDLEMNRRNLIKAKETNSTAIILTYEKFLESYPETNWPEYFRVILGKNPRPIDVVVFEQEATMKKLLHLLNITPSSALSNYYWTLFIQETNRNNCLNLSKKYFKAVYHIILEQSHFKIPQFVKLLNGTKKMYDDQISKSIWVDEISLAKSQLYWQKFKHYYEHSLSKVDMVYKKLHIDEANFYENLKQSETFINNEQIDYDSTLVDHFFNRTMNRSYVEDRLNLALNYGFIGTQLAKDIIKGTSDNISWTSTESNMELKSFENCFGHDKSYEAILEMLSIKLTYSLLEQWINGNSKFVAEYKQILSNSNQAFDDVAKMFFITNAMGNCGLGEKFVNEIVKNVEAFDMAFGCRSVRDVCSVL